MNRNYGGYATSNYPAVHGSGGAVRDRSSGHGDGVFGGNSGVNISAITRGTANVFLVGERSLTDTGDHGAIWIRSTNRDITAGDGTSVAGVCDRHSPLNAKYRPDSFGSAHNGGAHFALADGTVRFVGDSIDPTVYERSARIRDVK